MRVVAQKRAPRLARRAPRPTPAIAPNGTVADHDAELERNCYIFQACRTGCGGGQLSRLRLGQLRRCDGLPTSAVSAKDAESSAKDTDFTAKLVDVCPDG